VRTCNAGRCCRAEGGVTRGASVRPLSVALRARYETECAIDCVPNEAVEAELKIVQNNGLAFGGNNAVVVLGRHGRSGS